MLLYRLLSRTRQMLAVMSATKFGLLLASAIPADKIGVGSLFCLLPGYFGYLLATLCAGKVVC